MNERSIFAEALEKRDPAERCAFLDHVCGDNTQLRERVAALLRSYDDAGSFLDQLPEDILPTIAVGHGDTVDESVGDISLDFLAPCDRPDRLGVLGQYEVIEFVGRGGMGLVLRAHDSKLDRVVAIKVLAPELAANPMAVKRFLREAQAAAAVSHDHVVTIHAIEEDQRPPYIVMEFVDGLSLQEKIDRGGSLELREILRIGMQAASGLAAAHKQGLVHRDIKPANILLENGVERVKITDFGLARAVDDVNITRTGTIAGTPQYMSPEQAQGEAIDHRSDLFALGSVLYAMCTGRPAFRADNPMAVMRRVCDDDPRPVREVNADIPDWLEAIIDRLLAKDAEDRFQSADEVADLLSRWLAHVQQPALIPPPETEQPAGSRRSLKPHGDAKKRRAATTKRPVQQAYATRAPRWPLVAVGLSLLLAFVIIGAVVTVATDRGVLEVRSEVGDVQVSVSKNGQEVAILDVATGSKVKWLASDDYQIKLVGDDNDIRLDKSGFEMSRLGRVIVTAKWRDDDAGVIRRFAADTETITQDRVEAADGGWKITADKTRTVRLFEVPMPEMKPGLFFYRAKLRTENVEDRAYLEMWVRFPGKGEYFSKGFHNAISGTNGWAQYEIPFRLEKGQQPDLAKLNVVVEGGGTVWIKDIELRGRVAQNAVQSTHQRPQEIVLVRKYPGHTKFIDAIAFTPDGERFVTGGADKTLRIWGVRDGKLLATIRTGQNVNSLAVSPDGKYVTAGLHRAHIVLWDLETLREVGRFLGHAVNDRGAKLGRILTVNFSPDGTKLVSGGDDGTVRIWDVATRRQIRKFSDSGRAIQTAQFSPDGSTVLGADYGERITLWNAENGEQRGRFFGARQFAAYSPQGRWIVAGTTILDAHNFARVRRLQGVADNLVRAVHYAPDGRHIVMGCRDRTLRLFEAATGREVAKVQCETQVTAKLAVSPDGRYVASGGGVVWDAKAEKLILDGDYAPRLWRLPASVSPQDENAITEIRRLPGPKHAHSGIAWPTADRIISGTHNGIAVWDVVSGKLLAELSDRLPEGEPREKNGRPNTSGTAFAFAASADGKLAAAGHYQGIVCVWDVENRRQLHRLQAHWGGHKDKSSAYGLAFTPDNKHLVTGGVDGSTRVWNIGTGELVGEHDHGHRTRAMVMHPDGKHVLVGSFDNWLALIDWKTGRAVREFDTAKSGIWSLAVSPDGRLAASGSDAKNPIRLWDVKTGAPLHVLRGPTDTVDSITFTPDGRHIVCGTNDRTLRLYDVETGRGVFQLIADTHASRFVAVSPDGGELVTAGGKYWDYEKHGLVYDGDNDLRIWRLNLDSTDSDWTQLFNGRDLTGWQTHPDNPGGWRVEDGVLIGNSDDRSYLFSERGDYDDFHLRVEAKINANGNSGIKFRSPFELKPNGHHPPGYEAQILNGTWYWSEDQLDKDMTGSLVHLARVKDRLVPHDDWFMLEIIARDNHIVIKVNGQTTADYVDPDRRWTRGHISLQALTKTDAKRHQATVVQFRSIEIKDLNEPKAAVQYEGDLDLIHEFKGHRDWISHVAYTSDGQRVVTSGYDETIRVWDATSGKLLRTISTHNAPLAIALSPDDRHVVAGMYQAHVVMWDLENGKIVRPFVGHEVSKEQRRPGRILSVAFGPDGETLASGGDDGTVRLWEAATGKQLHKLETSSDLPADLPRPPVETVAFSPNGKTVLSANYAGTLALWEVENGSLKKSFAGDSNKHAAFSPDGKWIASGSSIFDATTCESKHKLRWEKGGNFVAHRFTPDSRHLVVGKSDGSLCVYDVATGKDVAVVRCSGTVTNVIAVSPDGRHVATGGGAYWSNEENKMIHDGDFALRIWRLPEAIAPPTPDTDAEAPQQSPAEIEEVGRFQGHKNWVYEVAFSADGKYAISVSNDRTVRVWNVESGESVHLFKTEKAATALDVSPDGKTIAVGYGPHDADKQSTSRIAAYALESGEAIGSLEAHRSEIRAIQFSPDGRFLVSASHDGTSRLWDVETWKEVRRFDDGDRDIFDAQFALDGRRVVTLEGFGGVGVWDVETGKKLCRLGPMVRGSELSSFAVEPDGKTALLCYARGLFERFDVKSGESTGRFRSETEFYPHDAVVTPDGRHVLVGGGDCTLRLLDVVTGRQLARVTRENNVFTRLAISPDGRFALSAGGRAWDAAKRVDSLTGDYEIRLWRLPEGAPPRTRDDGGTP